MLHANDAGLTRQRGALRIKLERTLEASTLLARPAATCSDRLCGPDNLCDRGIHQQCSPGPAARRCPMACGRAGRGITEAASCMASQ